MSQENRNTDNFDSVKDECWQSFCAVTAADFAVYGNITKNAFEWIFSYAYSLGQADGLHEAIKLIGHNDF